MVFAKIGDSSGVGFAIPSAKICDFVRTSGFRVSFSPPVLTESASTLRVLVDPMAANLQSKIGTVVLSGGNTQERRASFQAHGDELIAFFEIGQSEIEAAARDQLRATLTFTGGGEPDVRRAFRIRAASGLRRVHAEDVGAPSELKSQAGGSMPTLSGGLKGQRVEPSKGKATLVISDQMMQQIDEWRFSETWYEHLPNDTERNLALKYDKALYALYRLLVHEKSMLSMERSKSTVEDRPDCFEMLTKEGDAKRRVLTLQQKIKEYSLCRCDNTWWRCSEAPCPADKPWEEDRIQGFFDTIRCREL
jgi:hypothetical protein